jgi:hypothetical protein
MRSTVVIAGLFSLVAIAGAAPSVTLEARDAQSVRVKVGGESRIGFGLRPRAGEGWRLRLVEMNHGAHAEVVDVTPGTPARTLRVAMSGGELFFDHVRFQGGHVYRVQLRQGAALAGHAFVYLYPEAVVKEAPRGKESSRPAKIEFREESLNDSSGSDEIIPVRKSSL